MELGPLKLMALMYAASKFAEEAEKHLSSAGAGLLSRTVNSDLNFRLEMLEKRLAELR